MLPYEIIVKKRNGNQLTRSELQDFVGGFVDGRIPDYQMAALLMSIFFRGMTDLETAHLTEVMVGTGITLKPSSDRATVDKHSTGGVGDKVSLPLIALLAACDLAVPMISGRGLGHTGGTLDKMEAIPGFRTALSEQEFLNQVASIGMALASQTAKIVPADKKMYALRDVTGTVDSIPLISASIMSKKIAEGVQHLLLDVKTGQGAFMREESDAIALARSMVAIGHNVGLNVRAIITDMNQPLGVAIGNAIEVNESVDLLKGGGPDDLRRITLYLGAHLLAMAGRTAGVEEGQDLLASMIDNGQGLEKFRLLITTQGGDPAFLDRTAGLPLAKHEHQVTAPHAGWCEGINPVQIGFATTLLGGGRQQSTDTIDHQVGLLNHVRIGQRIEKDQRLVTVYYNNNDAFRKALPYIEGAFSFSEAPVTTPELIRDIIDATTRDTTTR